MLDTNLWALGSSFMQNRRSDWSDSPATHLVSMLAMAVWDLRGSATNALMQLLLRGAPHAPSVPNPVQAPVEVVPPTRGGASLELGVLLLRRSSTSSWRSLTLRVDMVDDGWEVEIAGRLSPNLGEVGNPSGIDESDSNDCELMVMWFSLEGLMRK